MKNELSIEVAKAINDILSHHANIKEKISIEPTELVIREQNNFIRWNPKLLKSDSFFESTPGRNEGKFHDYLFSLAKDRKNEFGIYYHFLKYDHAKKLIANNEFQLSSLNYYENSDPFEFSEFIMRYLNFDSSKKDFIHNLKNKYFILCLTDSFRNNNMWEKYGDNDSGVAIGLRFSEFTNNETQNNFYDLNDVYYDTGFDFDFLREIQHYLKKEINKYLWDINLYRFSMFYKRKKFEYEKEIRLCFNYNNFEELNRDYKKSKREFPDQYNLQKMFPIKAAEGRSYIDLPCKIEKNTFFNIEITDIICGKNITNNQFEELSSLKGNHIKLWYRK